jgi:Fur family peroxide stress response transcriptional regulator
MTSEAAPAQPDIEAVFHAKGIPFTRQRRLIWEYFAGATKATTIAELTAALGVAGIGQATIYRTVNLLSELGLLARVQDRRGEICYTAPSIGHSHPLICGACRRIVRFDGDGDLDLLATRLADETGFAIYGHHLEVYGLCEDCQAGGTDA